MAASVFDSPLYTRLFPTGETGRLFSDTAAIRAMLLVEGALAQAQGKLGIIPELSAAAIQRAASEIQIDPGALAASTGENGVCVPGLVAEFRREMQAPEHAQFVHWGATSQDIIDTGLMLRLRQCLALAEADLRAIIAALAKDADAHAKTPMAGRTYGQHATPTSWGAVLAGWGMPLIDAVEALPDLRDGALWVSLSGAAGTAAALGPHAAQLRADLAKGLGLRDPGRSWHVDRGPLLRIADWMSQVIATLAAMGHTIVGLTATDIREVSLGAAGASSTMPQKENPVSPSAIVALSHQFTGLRAGLQASGIHQHQRDGSAWFAEWLILPELCLTHASALHHARALSTGMTPDTAQMRRAVDATGMVHAEALSFALTDRMTRPAAQAATKKLCQTADQTRQSLAAAAQAAFPDLPDGLFDPTCQMGQAPAEAQAFVTRAGQL